MKPSEVLGVETELVNGKEIITKILGSRELIEKVRDQFPGARIVIRKPVMIELKLPDIPTDAPRRMMASEKEKIDMKEWSIFDAGFGATGISGIAMDGETISDFLLKPFEGGTEAEGERAIYRFAK